MDENTREFRQKLAALEAQAKAEYAKLTTEAKKAAAARLNEMNPSPGLTGTETFEEAAKKVGASIGSTIGVAACNAIPIPGLAIVAAHTACATLGALIGGYLGTRLGTWAKQAYADVRAWADKQWQSVQGAIGDAGDAVSDAAKDAYNFRCRICSDATKKPKKKERTTTMNTIFRVAIAGGAGVFAAEMLEPKLNEWFKPDSDFAKKATKAGAAAVGTGAAYWAIGLLTGKSS